MDLKLSKVVMPVRRWEIHAIMFLRTVIPYVLLRSNVFPEAMGSCESILMELFSFCQFPPCCLLTRSTWVVWTASVKSERPMALK